MASDPASAPLPALYIPHGGGPCFFMDWNPPDEWKKMGDWLTRLGETVTPRPKAILVISGHWEEPEFTLTGNPHPKLIYDYSGFPPHTYQLEYAAPGAPKLVQEISALLKSAGIPVRVDPQRGFDHGVFIPLKMIYPKADIPIVQLSLKQGLDPAEHIALGRALAPLRQEGVLITGSGMSYHNMRGFGMPANADSDTFDAWLTKAVAAPDVQTQLTHWAAAPKGRQSHPREEHLIPLMVAAGAGGGPGRKIFSDRVMGATESAFQFD